MNQKHQYLPFVSQTQRHLIVFVPSAESPRSRREKKGKCTVLLCVSKHNKSAAALKAGMTRTFFFFFYFSLFTLLTAYFIVYLLSLLPYPASGNPPPLRIHKASSYLFTRFLASFLLFFFYPCPFCCSGGSPGWKTPLGLFRVSPFRRHTEAPPPFCAQEGSGGTGLSFCVFPLFRSRPSLHPALLPSFCPCLLSWEEEREADRYQHV